MKKLITVIVMLFLASAAYAATPITCTALAGLGYNYIYFGFTGTGPDTFAMAGSNDGKKWTNIPATWPTCGNGTPCQVNSPSAVCYNNNVYLLIAEAHDTALNSTKQDIGILNTDYSVTTLLTFDWSALGAVSTIFAGRWDKVPGSTNCFVTPVTFTTGYYSWTDYAACATLTTTSATISSGPTAVTVSGSTNGMYDTQVIASPPNSTSSCTLVGTETNSGLSFRYSALATGNCPNGPFTWKTNAGTGGSPLQGQTDVSTQSEGPNYLQTNVSGGWEFWFEQITNTLSSHQNYYAVCTPITLTSCLLPTPQPWAEDQAYRAGTILRVTTTPLPGTTLQGGTLQGGTVQ